MLDFRNISVHYGHQDVLADVTFRVNKGDRIGVVGPNGSGKSTLFKIVLGELSTDTGELVVEGEPRIGWTPDLGDARAYTLWGRDSLAPSDGWRAVDPAAPSATGARFFRVSVGATNATSAAAGP